MSVPVKGSISGHYRYIIDHDDHEAECQTELAQAATPAVTHGCRATVTCGIIAGVTT